MAYTLYREGHSLAIQAASVILPFQPVRLIGTSALYAVPVGSNSFRPFGFNGEGTVGASGINSIDAGPVYEEGNIVKAVAAASMGVGAEVGVASANGALSPAAGAGASGAVAWACGIALTPAAAGERFSLYVRVRQTGGLA